MGMSGDGSTPVGRRHAPTNLEGKQSGTNRITTLHIEHVLGERRGKRTPWPRARGPYELDTMMKTRKSQGGAVAHIHGML